MPDNLNSGHSFKLPDYDYSTAGFYFITICTDQRIFHFGAIFDNVMVLNDIGRVARIEWNKLPERFPQICLGPFCVMPNHIHGIIQIISPSGSLSSSPSSFFDGSIPVGAGLAPAHADNANDAINANNDNNADNADNANDSNYDNHDKNSPLLITGIRAGASPAPTTEQTNQIKKGKGEEVTLGNIVGAYKSLVMKECLRHHKSKFPVGSEVPLLGKIWQRNYYEHIIRTQQSYDRISRYILTNPQYWTKDKFYIKIE